MTRRYRTDTLVLETAVETATGAIRAIDFMPPRGEAPDIVRIVEGIAGDVRMRSELVIRFDYGRIVPWVRSIGDATLAVAGPDALCLRSPIKSRGEDMTTVADFTVSPGERVPFVLTWFPSHLPWPDAIDPEGRARPRPAVLARVGGPLRHPASTTRDPQSLLVLKALTYAPTGGIVAAPTTSLPEWIGGVRNWDYRYCWLRDATLTLARCSRRLRDEAVAWREWLLRASPATRPTCRSCTGSRASAAWTSGRSNGCRGSRRPRRCGSATRRRPSSSSTSTAR